MAGRKTFELLFQLKASLGNNFNSAFKSAMDVSKQLQNNMSQANTLSGKIDGYQKQASALEDNKKKLADLNAEHDRLQKELKETEQPSAELQKQMEQNARQIEKTTAEIEKQEKNLDELGRELRDAGVDTNNLTEENAKLSDSYDKLKQSQESVAKVAEAQRKNADAVAKTRGQLFKTIGVIAAIGTAIYAGPVQHAQEFQTAMAKVSTIADATVLPLSDMEAQILKMSNTFGVAASTIAEDVYNAISAGQDTADAIGFLDTSMKLAKGGFAESAETLDLLTTVLNAYGLEASEAAAIADMLINTQNEGKVSVAEMAQTMGKVIPTANANNVAFEQLAACYNVMTAKGIKAAQTSTYVNSMLDELGKTGSKTDVALREMTGSSFSELMEQGYSLGDVLEMLDGHAAQTGLTLSDMFGSANAGKAALSLLGEGADEFNAALASTIDSAGATEEAFEKMMATTEEKVNRAKNSIKNLSIVFGNLFLPYVSDAADKVSDLVTRFSEWAQENQKLLSVIVKVAGGVALFTVGVLSAKLAFLKVKGAVLAVIGVITKLKALQLTGGIGSLLGKLGGLRTKLLPIIAIAGAIALAIKLISGNVEEVRGWIQKTFGDGALAVFDKIWGVIQNVGAAIKGVFSDGNIAGARNFFQNTFGEGGVAVFDALIGVVEQLKGIFPPLLDQLANLATTLLPVIGGLIKQILPLIGNVVATVLPLLFNLLAQLLPLVGQIIESILPVIINLIETLVPIVMQIIEAVLPVIIQLLESLMPIIATLIEQVLPIVIDLISSVISVIAPLIESVLPILTGLLEILMPIIQLVAEMFSGVLGTAINAVSGIISGLTKVLQGIIDFVTGVFTGNWSQAWEGVKNIFSGVMEALKNIVKAPINFIISAINTLIGGLNKLKIPDWVPGIGGKGFNIPEIPQFYRGTNSTPETFIAGERGAELITHAKNRAVFTAAATGRIFDSMKAAAGFQPAFAGAAGGVIAPSVASVGGAQSSFTIHSNPVIYVNGDEPGDLEEQLRRHDEALLQEVEERWRKKQDDERRRVYD